MASLPRVLHDLVPALQIGNDWDLSLLPVADFSHFLFDEFVVTVIGNLSWVFFAPEPNSIKTDVSRDFLQSSGAVLVLSAEESPSGEKSNMEKLCERT